MVFRVYVEKKPGFAVEAQQLCGELRTILGIEALEGVRIVIRYDVEGISQELLDVYREYELLTYCLVIAADIGIHYV